MICKKRGEKKPHCQLNKIWFLVVKSKSDGTKPETLKQRFCFCTSPRHPDVCCQNVVSFIPEVSAVTRAKIFVNVDRLLWKSPLKTTLLVEVIQAKRSLSITIILNIYFNCCFTKPRSHTTQ